MKPNDLLSKQGWAGEELPPGAQGVVVTRHFSKAVEVMTGNMLRLRDEMREVMNESNPLLVTKALSQNPIYVEAMNLLAEIAVEQGDALFRKSAGELFKHVRASNAEMLVALSVGLWVSDGAELPQEIIDLAKRQNEADEELDEEE